MSDDTRHPYGLSDTAMEHFINTRNAGSLPEPSGEGWSGSVETSRFMRIQVRLNEGRIEDARFGTYGCAPAIAAGSFITEWARGVTVDKARAYTAKALLKDVGGLPKHRLYCADLAVDALHAALDDALQSNRSASSESDICTSAQTKE